MTRAALGARKLARARGARKTMPGIGTAGGEARVPATSLPPPLYAGHGGSAAPFFAGRLRSGAASQSRLASVASSMC